MNMHSNFLKTFIFSFICLGLSFNGVAQERNKERIKEKVKLEKVAYITQELALTEDEAQKFWPIYNAYKEESGAMRASMDIRPRKDMSDKEAEDMLYAMLDAKSKEIDIQKKYIGKMKSAIPAKKIAMLFKVERQFKEKLVSNIKERRKDRMEK
jgi:adenosine deaminase